MTATDRTTPVPANPAFEAQVRDSFIAQGLMATLGARLVTVEPGRVVIEMPFSPAVSQQHGLFHGGAIGAIGDTAGGYAALTLMQPGSEVVTVEYKINFLRPAMGRLVRAEGRIIRAGRSVLVGQIDVTVIDQGGQERACSALLATFMRVERQAKR